LEALVARFTRKAQARASRIAIVNMIRIRILSGAARSSIKIIN